MKKIKDITTALSLFEDAAAKQAEATSQGDYKMGNKYYDTLVESVAFLKRANAVNQLLSLLAHRSIGVRMWAAVYLLPIHEKEGVKILEQIMKIPGIHALTAETTLSEWRNGKLKL